VAIITQVAGRDQIAEEVISCVDTEDVKMWSPEIIEPDGQGGFFINPQLMQSGELYPFRILTIPFAAYKYEDGSVAILGIPD
jgi:hypothetical protein